MGLVSIFRPSEFSDGLSRCRKSHCFILANSLKIKAVFYFIPIN
uniref:Uncharacterized protein n=1 Tax=Siphoviridae sp. ctLeG9 TaxID=2827848 RepID=A0A8S5RVB1_9CAUD|nr:MAG TPA: hypothetical protein [Siphoviridae sp. ctLeG9]